MIIKVAGNIKVHAKSSSSFNKGLGLKNFFPTNFENRQRGPFEITKVFRKHRIVQKKTPDGLVNGSKVYSSPSEKKSLKFLTRISPRFI